MTAPQRRPGADRIPTPCRNVSKAMIGSREADFDRGRRDTPMMEIFPGIWTWEGPERGHPDPVRAYAVSHGDGLILVDPAYQSEGASPDMPGDIDPLAILLTSHYHVRASESLRSKHKCPVFIHRSERDWTGFLADDYFDDGDFLIDKFQAIRLPNSAFERATAYLMSKSCGALFVGDAITSPIGNNLGMTRTRYLKRTRASVGDAICGFRILLEYDFDVLLPGHGPPVTSGAKSALKSFFEDPITSC